jgi:hypothetical protein
VLAETEDAWERLRGTVALISVANAEARALLVAEAREQIEALAAPSSEKPDADDDELDFSDFKPTFVTTGLVDIEPLEPSTPEGRRITGEGALLPFVGETDRRETEDRLLSAAQAIGDATERAAVLRTLTSAERTSDPRFLSSAFDALKAIGPLDSRLAALTPRLAALAPAVLLPEWQRLLRESASQPRNEFLHRLKMLVPFIPALAGDGAATDAALALKQISERWP